MVGNGAREATNLHRLLTFRSLIALRFCTAMTAYFILSVRSLYFISPNLSLTPQSPAVLLLALLSLSDQ